MLRDDFYRMDMYSTEFIKRLKLEEIENFFAPFGLMACAKIPNEKEPKFILVSCKDFQVVFSDYSQEVVSVKRLINSNGSKRTGSEIIIKNF